MLYPYYHYILVDRLLREWDKLKTKTTTFIIPVYIYSFIDVARILLGGGADNYITIIY